MQHTNSFAALVLSGFVAAGGCAFSQHGAWVEARDAYDECVAAHGGSAEACKVERDAANQRYEDYEREAQRAWGCEHVNDCQVGRDRDLD